MGNINNTRLKWNLLRYDFPFDNQSYQHLQKKLFSNLFQELNSHALLKHWLRHKLIQDLSFGGYLQHGTNEETRRID
jgi:hypothetical protein